MAGVGVIWRVFMMAENDNVMGNKGHVLLVDDEDAILEALTDLLESCGYKVTPATCYDDAISAMEKDEGIEAVICDLKMPGRSGLEVLRFLKENKKKIALIFLTGSHDCFQEGSIEGSEYVLKPIDSKDKILQPLERAIHSHRQK